MLNRIRRFRIVFPMLVLLVLVTSMAIGQDKDKKNEKKDGDPAPTAGCASTEIKSGKEKGLQKRFYEAPLPKVKEALLGALAALEFNVKKDTGNEISAQKSRHMGVFVGSGGETLNLKLAEGEEDGKKGTVVEGETKKGFVGRAGQKSWTNAVFDQTACIMAGNTTTGSAAK